MEMTTNPNSFLLVPELLKNDNYERWRVFMEHYIIGRDLWDVVVQPSEIPEDLENQSERKRKNALALHAIKISCEAKVFDQIKHQQSAKDAWIALASITSKKHSTSKRMDRTSNDSEQKAALLCARSGKMNAAKSLFEKNKKLFTIKDAKEKIPVQWACEGGNEDVARYLYRKTPLQFLDPKEGCGLDLLKELIRMKMFDIAYDLLVKFPELISSNDSTIVTTLAKSSESPFSNQLGFFSRLIYNCMIVKVKLIKSKGDINTIISAVDEADGLSNGQSDKRLCTVIKTAIRKFGKIMFASVMWIVVGLLSLPLQLVSMVLKLLGIKQIYALKLNHTYARKFLDLMCKQLEKLDSHQLVQSGAVEATFLAIKNGIPEIAIAFVKAKQDIVWTQSDHCDDYDFSMNMFAWAIIHRQEKVAHYLHYEFDEIVANIVTSKDADGNNILHVAAKLAPDAQLARISGAALQLQSELKWFKETEAIFPRYMNECENEDGETPSQVFVREHKNLLKEAEDWVKKAAESATVVGALIITIMFAAAFTVPGGNNQNTGLPIFSNDMAFQVFIICDAISLFAASSSVLMFLGILTSRYAWEDFLKSLPKKLIFGLSSLFISIATMMAAFCAALFIMLQGQLQMVIPITLLASVPVTFFGLLQIPLFVEIFSSAFSPNIFHKNVSFIEWLRRECRLFVVMASATFSLWCSSRLIDLVSRLGKRVKI